MLRVGFFQFHPRFGETSRNCDTVIAALAGVEADLMVLPELPFSGYYFQSREEAMDLAEDPADVAALTVRADALLELGDVEEAASLYGAVAARERVATTVSRLSRAAFLAGDPQGAIDLSIEALELAADLPLRRHDAAFYWFQLASNLEKVGQIAGARHLGRETPVAPHLVAAHHGPHHGLGVSHVEHELHRHSR